MPTVLLFGNRGTCEWRRREQREAPLPDEPVVPPVAVPPEPEQAAVAERSPQPGNRGNLDFVFVLLLFLGMMVIVWNESNNVF